MKTLAPFTGSWILLVLLCAALLSSGPAAAQDAAAPAGGTPAIVFDESAHDFGDQPQNAALKHTFTFKNTGDATLKIEKVRTTCGCTAALASEKEIPPGGSGKIDVTFKIGSRGGKKQKAVKVYTNDPTTPMVKLDVIATVKVLLGVTPARLGFGQIDRGITVTKYVSLTGDDRDTCHVLSAQSRNSALTAEVSPDGYGGDAHRVLKITLTPDMPIGRFRERITVTTDHPTVKQMTIYAYGEVLGNIRVQPNYLSFGMLKADTAVEKTIRLTATGDTPFTVTSVRSTIPEVTVTSKPLTPNMVYEITARVDGSFSKPLLKGSVIIETDSKDQGKIEVRFFGRQRPQRPPGPLAPDKKGT